MPRVKRHKHRRPFAILLRREPGGKGTFNRKVIASGDVSTVDGSGTGSEGRGQSISRDHWLHATKGYRNARNPE